MALKKMRGGFKMRGFNPGVGTGMGSAFNSNGPVYGGDGRTWAEAAEASGGTDMESNLDMIVKNQRAYEKRMESDNSDWNKREDDIWKKRQNEINEMLGSSKRYEITEKVKVKDHQMNVPLTDDVRQKTVEKGPEGKEKNVQRINEDGEVVMNKDVDKDEDGVVKLKQKFDEETGKVIKVKGYSTGKKRPGAKEYKANQKLKADRNKLEIRINNLKEGSKKRLRLEEKLDNMPTPKSDEEIKKLLEGMGSSVSEASASPNKMRGVVKGLVKAKQQAYKNWLNRKERGEGIITAANRAKR